MSNYKKDIIGSKFGKLTIIKEVKPHIRPSGATVPMFECFCECGAIVNVCKYELTTGKIKSCGCLKKEHAKRISTHGESKTRLYALWRTMKSRCYGKYYHGYANYGGRGISVCDEWKRNFLTFKEWAISNGWSENKPGKQQSLDIIDTNGNYEPSNCRFVSMKTQENNRRNSLQFNYNGLTFTLLELSQRFNIPRCTLYDRIVKYGYSIEEAIMYKPHEKSHLKL